MCERTYKKTFDDIKKEDVWQVWTDVNNWYRWNPGIERSILTEPFAVGNFFTLQPKEGPVFKIEIVEVDPYKKFTDCTTFFGSKMYGIHEMYEDNNGLTLKTTIKFTGLLGFVWQRLIGGKIFSKIPEQTENIVNFIKNPDTQDSSIT